MTATNKLYTYRVFPPARIEERLNEARSRGWALHTFCDATEDTWASAVFHWDRQITDRLLPFADDEEEEEEPV